MHIKALHPNFIMPTKSRQSSAGYDLYMPEAGFVVGGQPTRVALGFAAAIPEGHVGLILPRSGVGARYGLELNNTCGVIDADYRGEWIAILKSKTPDYISWELGDRMLQVLIVPVASPELVLVDELDTTQRGDGGFGSSGN